jgi:hypothetical protein
MHRPLVFLSLYAPTMSDFFHARRPHDGWTYGEYMTHWKDDIADGISADMGKSERKMLHYKQYNLERTHRVHEAYTPSNTLKEAVQSIESPQLWMVLTEPWCGDSAYNLPVIADAASLSANVSLRIVPRDENLDIMDQYLTDGGRSIPKLVAFSHEGDELFTWGPRPDELQAFRQQLINDGVEGSRIVQRLIDRYEEGAWRAVDRELTEILTAVHSLPS